MVALAHAVLQLDPTAPLPAELLDNAALRAHLGMASKEVPLELSQASMWTYAAALGLWDVGTDEEVVIVGEAHAADLSNDTLAHPFRGGKAERTAQYSAFRKRAPVMGKVLGSRIPRAAWAVAVGDVTHPGKHAAS